MIMKECTCSQLEARLKKASLRREFEVERQLSKGTLVRRRHLQQQEEELIK